MKFLDLIVVANDGFLTCFPVGTLGKPNMKDLQYIEDLKKLIEKEKVHAPSPIEQR